MPQSETVLAKLINAIAGDGKDSPPRKQKIDAHELPDFSVVRHYLGPGGSFVTNLNDGWICTGLMMQRQPSTTTGSVAAEPGVSTPR